MMTTISWLVLIPPMWVMVPRMGETRVIIWDHLTSKKKHHGYIPLVVLARVLEENEESTHFMITALGKVVRYLFGLKIEFNGGLILTMPTVLSMHTNMFPQLPERTMLSSCSTESERPKGKKKKR
jgi:hypothetical protein